MKIDAEVEMLIDDELLGISSGCVLKIPIDTDYAETEYDVASCVVDELNMRYGMIFKSSVVGTASSPEFDEFTVNNMKQVLEDIKYDDCLRKVEV